MTELLIAALFSLIGYWVGAYWPKHWHWIRSVWRKYRMGICFNYRGKGHIENINGTLSDYCQNCGHPAGYHT